MILQQEWQLSPTDQFWTDIAPNDHVLQLYDNNEELFDLLAGYVGGGINAGDSVVVIATRPHLDALELILKTHGIHLGSLIEGDRYIPLDATETLSKFMVNGWPNEELFMKVVSGLMKRARGEERRKVRAFGEMVALLWEQGHHGATHRLESLWNKFCQSEELCLFCAYPKFSFTGKLEDSMPHICSSHGKIITGTSKPLTEILYQVTTPMSGTPAYHLAG